jgi:hypothetical protein
MVLSSCFSEMLEEEYGMENLLETPANITYIPSFKRKPSKERIESGEGHSIKLLFITSKIWLQFWAVDYSTEPQPLPLARGNRFHGIPQPFEFK